MNLTDQAAADGGRRNARDPANEEIHLSVVATTRNDDHGGSLTRRTQHFVDGLVAQCKRHGLRAELILVEWNPPKERAPLIRELRWPADPGPCDIRIVTVPPEQHLVIAHADKIRLFQMLAKNVGIRRARGRYVLATNIDILFSDAAFRFLRDRLRPGRLYLADRADVPAELPAGGDFEAVLKYCEDERFRVNTGGLIVERRTTRWRFFDQLKMATGARLGYFLDRTAEFLRLVGTTFDNPRWAFRRLVGRGLAVTAAPNGDSRAGPGKTARLSRARLPWLLAAGAWDIVHRIVFGVVKRLGEPFTNACGDFMVMSREDWFRIRGYVEWPMFSWHLDSLLVYQALANGIRATRLDPQARVYHIDHSGGFAPQQAATLFSRLESQGIPFLTDQELQRLHAEIAQKRRAGQAVQFNQPDWGLDAVRLPEGKPETS